MTPAAADDDYWDFRNGHFDNLSLLPMGPGAVNLLRPTDTGLNVTAPAGYKVGFVGFSPKFKISGDVEITVGFTIKQRTQPKSGFGSGPTVYVSMGTTKDAAASVSRVLRKDGRDAYGLFGARVEEGERIPTAKLFDAPKTKNAITGQLTLARKGNEIRYSIADSSYGELRELGSLEVSDEDLTLVRIGLNQSDADSAAEIVLHDVLIVADELPQLPSAQARTAQLFRPRYLRAEEPASYTWLWCLVAGLVAGGGLVFWLWKRRR